MCVPNQVFRCCYIGYKYFKKWWFRRWILKKIHQRHILLIARKQKWNSWFEMSHVWNFKDLDHFYKKYIKIINLFAFWPKTILFERDGQAGVRWPLPPGHGPAGSLHGTGPLMCRNLLCTVYAICTALKRWVRPGSQKF